MRLILTVLLSLWACAGPADAQTTTRRAASPTATTSVLTVTVTDGKGAPLSGVTVRLSGPVDREATTEAGMLRLEGLRSGSYRLRFARDGFITLERDLNIAAGQRSLDQHVMLSIDNRPAPAPASPPPADIAKPAPLPPPGKAVTVSIPDFVEQNLITGSQPQKVSTVACSGLVQSVLWQVREAWDNRVHANADAMLYVIGGEGSLRMNDRDVPLQAGRFVSVPRGTTYGLTRRGRNPLILLATLGGEPCTP